MLLRRHGSFSGGIDLPDEKRATLGLSIEACPRPRLLRVPLAPCGGSPAELSVKEGDSVTAGEKIATGSEGVDIYAPASGRIGKTVTAKVACGTGTINSLAIEILAVRTTSAIRSLAPVYDWRNASAPDIRNHLNSGGLTTARPDIEPLGKWVERGRRAGCELIIMNVVESQPYVTADHRLLAEHGSEVIRGLMIIAKALTAKEMILAVDQRHTSYYRKLVGAARACGIQMVALPPKYPVGNDLVLVKVLQRRETPIGKEPFDVGVGVTDASTCFAAYRWVACQSPQTARVVTVNGNGQLNRGNYWTPYGTDCTNLIEGGEETVVHGGPMGPVHLASGVVVCASTDAVLNINTLPRHSPSPCIRCGWCTDHCPSRLNVRSLNDCFELGNLARARRLKVQACVECGVCSYVCPARLDLCGRLVWMKRQCSRVSKSGKREVSA